jgi:RNA polymerase sigma-70 factor, ECF subfamily
MTLEFADPRLQGGPAAVRARDRYYSAHYLAVLRHCVRQLGDAHDAEDATQETFRRAVQQNIGDVEDPLPWLLTVARNVCVDEIRRRRSGRHALERTFAQGVETERGSDDAHGDPEPMVVGRMFVDELLGRLTPAERRVVAARFINGQSGGELAEALGVTASTTRVLLARARQKMRRYLLEGQGLAGAACLAARTRLHGLRRRLLAHAGAMQPRTEMLLPALVVTAMVAPVAMGQPAAALPRPGQARPGALMARNLDAGSTVAGRSTLLNGGSTVLSAGGPASSGHRGAPSSGGPSSPLDGLLPAPDPNQVWTTDFEPSPDYQSDHTVFMVGAGNCLAWCGQLFRSSDGGATWTYMSTRGLSASQLLLPAASYAEGRFFGTGSKLLEVTENGGGSFSTYGPAPQFAVAAPSWLGGVQVVTADVALSFLDATQVPRVVAPFGAGMSAASVPVLRGSASGWTALLAVTNEVLGGPDTLLRCSAGGCTALAQLPFGGTVQVVAPDAAATSTVAVIGAGGVAVSRDGGASFALASAEPVSQVVAVPGPAGQRLVGVDLARSRSSDFVPVYSDDWGRTWQPASMASGWAGALYVHTPRMLAAGRLIASAADPTHPGMHVFICSADGSTWAACAADRS